LRQNPQNPHPLRQEIKKKSKPASVRQVKPASVAAEPASIAAGKARIRAAGEARIRCGISLTHNGSPKVYVRYYKNDVYI